MSTTQEQRLAQAEATARRWRRHLEAMAGSDASDEKFSIVHRYCAAKHAVVLLREGAPPPPTSQRS